MSDNGPGPGAFAADRRRAAARATLGALVWGATGLATRRIASRPGPAPEVSLTRPSPTPGLVRRRWREAFAKDAADIAAGLYPPAPDGAPDPAAVVRRLTDLLADARNVDDRRRRGAGTEARQEAPGRAYPAYYRQNFHFQTGGWFTAESARRYEAQVETLFAGAAGPMRRRALSLLARAWRGRDHRGLVVLDLACGSGSFLADLAAAFPRARLTGIDLSAAYLAEAGRRSGVRALIQAGAERLPMAEGSVDALTCVYLFHELPPKVRPKVAAEIARVLKPGGLLAFADALQPSDEPELGRLLEAFPAYFHEPYFESYGATDLVALFGAAGLHKIADDRAFLTKALLFEK